MVAHVRCQAGILQHDSRVEPAVAVSVRNQVAGVGASVEHKHVLDARLREVVSASSTAAESDVAVVLCSG